MLNKSVSVIMKFVLLITSLLKRNKIQLKSRISMSMLIIGNMIAQNLRFRKYLKSHRNLRRPSYRISKSYQMKENQLREEEKTKENNQTVKRNKSHKLVDNLLSMHQQRARDSKPLLKLNLS